MNSTQTKFKADPYNPSNKLISIQDVVHISQDDGAVLQYNAVTDKYEIKNLDLAQTGLDVDGGTF